MAKYRLGLGQSEQRTGVSQSEKSIDKSSASQNNGLAGSQPMRANYRLGFSQYGQARSQPTRAMYRPVVSQPEQNTS